ncbi:MAG TPA: SurA N-terminal domain-containing protein [Nevskiaceae bacterium]|nr:SurA N-terminal domain-containing protein [Nevskiaceae bacterium]
MLQSIRDRLTGPLVWVVIGLICVPFAFWGIESFRTDGGDPVVATVGDEEITQSQLDQGYQQRYQQLQALLGENFRADLFDATRFRQTVLDDLVQESLLRQHARDAGFRADDQLLIAYLSTIPAFQDQGQFSPALYRERLQMQGFTPERFERQLRESLVIDQLREALVDTSFATPAETERAFQLARQQRAIRTVDFALAPLLDAVAVTDAQIQARYDEQIERYQAPERIRLAYVELDASRLPQAEAPAADVLKVIYDAEKDSRFSAPEERKARHILINFGADKDAARARIEALAERLRKGESFETLAAAQSDDSGSKTQGGDLGWIKRGMMVERFEEALFQLDNGQLSEPVETEFGWHLIRVDEIRPAAVRPFEEAGVQTELLTLFRARDNERRFQELSETMEQLAFESPTGLEAVAEAVGQPVQTTDWVTRAGGAGITASREVMEAAFAPEVLEDGENSKPVALEGGRLVVVRKAEYEAARTRPLSEVREAIVAELKREGAQLAAREQAAALTAALQPGVSVDAVLQGAGRSESYRGIVSRSAVEPDPAVVGAAFTLAPPSASAALPATVVTRANGDLSWVVVEQVTTPPAPASSDAELQRLAQQRRDSLAGAEFAAFREQLERERPTEIRAATPAAPVTPES